MVLRGQKPLGPIAVADAVLAATVPYAPYLPPVLVSRSVAFAIQASEGSVATPESPNVNCCFS